MSWLKNKLRNWILLDSNEVSCEPDSSYSRPNRLDGGESISFRVISANNGKILEYTKRNERDYKSSYDSESTTTHYIIPKDETIGAFVDKCITLEGLK